MSRRVPRDGLGPESPNEPDDGYVYGDQAAQRNRQGANGYNGNGQRAPGPNRQHPYGGPGPAGYGQQPYGGRGGNGRGPQGYDQRGAPGDRGQGYDNQGYDNQPTRAYDYQGNGGTYPAGRGPRGYQGGPGQGSARRPGEPQRLGGQRYEVPGHGPGGPAPRRPSPPDGPPARRVRFRRTRRFFRRRVVRIVSAVVAVFLVFVMFSAGQAAFRNNGQGVSANLAEWARDHYLGPVVTFGEWLSYNPPPTGGKPSFSLAVPSGEAVSSTPAKGKARNGFAPDVPATLKSLAPAPIAGEGQWRVVEKVNGQPAILATFLRDATYTSEVNGIASIDQRLVRFSLRPGTEDPGTSQNWGVPAYIPAGQRTGLLATFNGGFKLDSAGGGFYLNGIHHGSLESGTASVVYYKDGTVKIGQWGRDFTMNPSIAGVRQNLKLLVDHGKVSVSANSDVMSNWGATLGGGYYVWRSGIGITSDGRVVYVYGSALNAQDLGLLLQRAGAVEGMQMDINPSWMKFDYYQAKGNPGNPVPVKLLPTQQADPYSYYTPSTRDFTAVYAR